MSSSSPRRSISSSSASKQRGNMATGFPPCGELASRRVETTAGKFIDMSVVVHAAHSERFRTSAGLSARVCAILGNMEATLNARAAPLTGVQWLILGTAGIGFAFDMYEIVVQAIVVRPLLMELGPFQPGTPKFNHWTGHHAVPADDDRRTGRPRRRLSYRPPRAAARAGLEHRAVRRGRFLLGFRHLAGRADLLALHHGGRRLRGIRRGHRLADRALSRIPGGAKRCWGSRRYAPRPAIS